MLVPITLKGSLIMVLRSICVVFFFHEEMSALRKSPLNVLEKLKILSSTCSFQVIIPSHLGASALFSSVLLPPFMLYATKSMSMPFMKVKSHSISCPCGQF